MVPAISSARAALSDFSPVRFKRYANELSRAVHALSEEAEVRRRYGVRYYTQGISVTPISRLKEKLGKAAGVAQRAATAIEAEADALIAQEDVIRAKTTDAFAPHKAILAEANTELQAIKDALNLMSNGGPPLSEPEPTVSGSNAHVDDTGEVERIKLNSA